MKKYLIVAALVLFVPQPINAQADGFYLMVDNTTKQCRVMPGSELRVQRDAISYSSCSDYYICHLSHTNL